MAKSPPNPPASGSPGTKSPADKSAQPLPPTAVAKRAKTGTSGNGNRSAEQSQLELVPELSEEEVGADEAEAEDAAASAVAAASQPASSPAPSSDAPLSAAPPTMRELGLTAKEMWKVDLKGKRIALDEKAWREELARALGRTPSKG